MIATVKKSGYTAQVIKGKDKAVELTARLEQLPSGFALLDDALAQAKRENKPLILDFHAEWCVPCRRMEKTTLADARITTLLKQTVFIRVDTDANPEIARKLGVVGLPDIRFVAPDGRVLRQLRGYQDADSFATAIERIVQVIGK
ncbi:MAG TPA: thioredoxin family protein [Blastocatellia bacterium]|nr:thioredoxin family protein [Blastocatellia bacterium]HMY71893.1 thioredoxin family protein [Blastocatellia bacterium]HNG34858.1 thioredoxin family protein [Blastocatellia bacterium]